MAPLKQHWLKIYTPLVEHLKLQVRFNPKAKAVEIRSHASTVEVTAVQRAAEYVKAFCCGFSCEVRMGCGVCLRTTFCSYISTLGCYGFASFG